MKTPVWLSYSLQAIWVAMLVTLFLFAASNTKRLAEGEIKIQQNGLREPEAADPTAAYVEILLPSPVLPSLSAGYMAIAPSMHLIRLTTARPLSNIDPIEHPARRRFGRIDLSFAFLIALPIFILPVCFLIYRQSLASGAVGKLMDGKVMVFDFCVERILLPLGFFMGILLLTTLGALYTNGLRIDSNELLARLSLWALIIGLYVLAWFLVFLWCLLRQSNFAEAALVYSTICVFVLLGLPLFLQTAESMLAPPVGRLSIVLERRQLTQTMRDIDHPVVDSYLQTKGAPAFDWSRPLRPTEASSLTSLRVEDRLSPKIKIFEDSVQSLEGIVQSLSWISPLGLTQTAIDDLAGTGLSRYSKFRSASIAYFNRWQAYMLPFLAKRQTLDFDALRAAPKFQFKEEEPSFILGLAALRALYLAVIVAGLLALTRRQLNRILPKNANAAR